MTTSYASLRAAKALQEFLAAEDGANLLTAYKRATNIVGIEEKKDKITYISAELNKGSLKEKEEIALAEALAKKSSAIADLSKQEKFAEAMKNLAELRSISPNYARRLTIFSTRLW